MTRENMTIKKNSSSNYSFLPVFPKKESIKKERENEEKQKEKAAPALFLFLFSTKGGNRIYLPA